MPAKLLQSCLTVTPRIVACKAPLSIGFSRQEYWRSFYDMPVMRAVCHQVATAGRLPTTAVVAIPVHGLGGRISAPRAHVFHGLGDHLCSCRCRIDYGLIVGLKIKSLKSKASPQMRIQVPC